MSFRSRFRIRLVAGHGFLPRDERHTHTDKEWIDVHMEECDYTHALLWMIFLRDGQDVEITGARVDARTGERTTRTFCFIRNHNTQFTEAFPPEQWNPSFSKI